MLRLIYVTFLSCLSMFAIGQNVEIQKSTDIVVIRGKSYYLHTVLPGQTLYSICKAYGFSVEEVKELNDKKDNSLSPYDVLKLSYAELFVQRDDEYHYHKVLKGETLYSIARHYDIKPKRLLKHNKEYEKVPLSIGAIVRLPLDDIDIAVLNSKGTQVTNVVVPVARVVADVEPEVIEKPKSRKDRKKQEEIDNTLDTPMDMAVNIDTLVQDSLSIQGASSILQDGNREMPSYISEVVMPSNPFVKIALLLPFSAGEYPMLVNALQADTLLVDSSAIDNVVLSDRSNRFISFYGGILFAVDSLKKQGYKIELHVFDTELKSEKMYWLADKINHLNPDLIIGPVYGTTYKVLIDTLQNKHIPIIYPLSSRSDKLGQYPNFVQCSSSFEVLADQMLNWIEKQGDSANIINLDILNIDYADQYEKKVFRDALKQIEGVLSFNWDIENMPLDSLRTLFVLDRENIVVLPLGKEADVHNVLSRLSALTDVYSITVLGLPEWQSFESVEHETYYKLNTKIFAHSYVDYSKDETKAIVGKFRKCYHTEPNTVTLKAFDMGLYFIELAAKYRHNTLAALEYYDRSTNFSTFRFRKMKNGGLGQENNGFHLINYRTDFLLKIEDVEK